MMDVLYKIADWDKEIFLFINGQHISWLDPIMLGLSSFVSWICMCVLIIMYMLYKGGRWRFVAPLFMLLTIGLNSGINHLVKLIIARPRPLHVEVWQGIIHAIEEYETSYSFFSAHSSNSFSMAVFSLLFFRNKMYGCFILLWATLVAYSRIYVGKHYPMDVFCGIAFGIMMGFLCFKLFERYKESRLRKDNL